MDQIKNTDEFKRNYEVNSEAFDSAIQVAELLFESGAHRACRNKISELLNTNYTFEQFARMKVVLIKSLIMNHKYNEALGALELINTSPMTSPSQETTLIYAKLLGRISSIERALELLEMKNLNGTDCWLELNIEKELQANRFLNAEMYRSKFLENKFLRDYWNEIILGFSTGMTTHFYNAGSIAMQRRQWEYCRKATEFELQVDFSMEKFTKLFKHSPDEEYRNLILKKFNLVHSKVISVCNSNSDNYFDLDKGASSSHRGMVLDRLSLRLLNIIAEDLYRPKKIGEIAERLYENEEFDFTQSPRKTRQQLFKLRRKLKPLNIGLNVELVGGAYKLKVEGSLTLRKGVGYAPKSPQEQLYSLMIEKVGVEVPILANTVCERLVISRSTFLRFVKWAKVSGKLKIEGRSTNTRYLLVACS